MTFTRNSVPETDVFGLHDGGIFLVAENPHLDCQIGAGQKVCTLVGQSLELKLTVRGHGVVWDFARRPPGSRATISAGRFAVDLPGFYLPRVTIAGGWLREIPVVAFPREALDRVGFGPVTPNDVSALYRRLRLRGITNDPRCTPERVIACLEPPGDPCLGLAGALLGEPSLNPQHYGGF